MSTMLIPAGQWAQNAFGFAPLGDKRRNQRLVNIAQNLAAHPGGTLPQAFPHWTELKAAYRFFGQAGVSFQQNLIPHLDRTRASCRQPGEYLIIEDTTLLDYSTHSATADLGQIGDGGRGFELHSALAVRGEGWTLAQRSEGSVIGLFGQSCVTPRLAPAGESRRQRLSRPRKRNAGPKPSKPLGSAAGESMDLPCGSGIRLLRADPPLSTPWRRFHHSRFSRPALGWRGGPFAGGLGQGRRAGADDDRAARSRRATGPHCERGDSGVRVDLDGPWRPGGWQAPLTGVTAVEVREVQDPAEIKPLHWLLLTSLPCTTWASATGGRTLCGTLVDRGVSQSAQKWHGRGGQPIGTRGSAGGLDRGAGRGGRAFVKRQNAGAQLSGKL